MLSDGMLPFTIALGLLFGLLLLEILFAFVGGTLLGMGGGEIEIDGPEVGIEIPEGVLDSAEVEPWLAHLVDPIDLQGDTPGTSGLEKSGIGHWLGFGRMPSMIWLASALLAFGVTGLSIQMFSETIFGSQMPRLIASVPALVAAVLFTRSFGDLFARILPRTETQSVSERHLGRRMGVVTTGIASKGKPAEVRVTDRFGNVHHIRAEPLNPERSIPAGSEVLVMRHRYEQGYLIIPLAN